jgi:putative salt-induced outer membrane protein
VSVLYGDQVVLKNGDRLTGTILKSDAKTLTLKSEFAGQVTIQWDAVVSISSDTPLNLTLKDGQVVVGKVATVQSNLEIATKDTGTVSTTKAAVQAIRNKDEQAAYEREIERLRNPGLLDLWSGYVDLGLANASGNSKTTTFNLGMNAVRATPRDKVTFQFTSLYDTNSTSGTSVTTANTMLGGVRYDVNVRNKVYGFGFSDFEFNEFQKLDLRFAPGGGLGYHAYKKEKTYVDFFGGGALSKEYFSTGLKRSSGEALAGDEVSFAPWKATVVKQRFVLYPNVSEMGEFRMNLDISAVTRLNKWLSWQVTMSDRFLSNPVPGTKKNDSILTTGLRVTFAK